MKKFLFFFAMLFAASLLSAQTIVFRENFDPTSNADSVTASGALNNFAINTRLFHSGTQCDSTLVSPNGTAYLTTNSFSTVGFGYVFLNFSHICKIELLDSAKIEVSIDNGVTWTKLTGAQYVNPGNSQFVTLGNIFNSLAYPDWLATTGTAKPTNSWWKDESFDISALVSNQPNVRIRFSLKDGNGNGAFFNHGWYIDDIKVTAAISELSPPNITMKPPVVQDTVFYTGPFDIYAWITDASGIDTAYIDYQVNGGPHLYIPMLWVSDSTYKGTIPSYTFNNQIDYHVYAIDNSVSHNSANGPNQWFYVKKGPNIVQIGTGSVANSTSTYPTPYGQYYGSDHEQYLILASELNAAGLMPGQVTSLAWDLASGYSYADLENFQINLANTSATSMSTLITTGFTQVYGQVTYTPPSSAGWATINFTTPFVWDGVSNIVVDVSFSNCSVCNGTTSCTTSYTNNGIVNQTTTAFISTVNYYYDGNCTINTFFPSGNYNNYTYSQRPNIKLGSPATNYTEDAGVKQILTPTGTIVAGANSPVTLLIKNYGLDTLKKVNIAWKLDGVLQTPYPWFGLLAEAITSGILNVGNVNVGVGSHIIKAWTEMPNDSVDQNHANDTSTISFYACASILNGTYTIGPGGDYPDFASALTALSNCGISDPVIFNVASGTYNEQLNMPVIIGISAINTVTFQSATGNYADVTIHYAATSAANNFVVKLSGSSYLAFKNMTLQATGTAFATVVNYSGNSTNNTFMGNKLKGIITTTSTSTDLAVVYSPSGAVALDSVMTFDGNIVENGSYGFYLYGQGSSAGQLENKTIIRNNQLTNQYYCGIYLYYQNAPELVSNIISTNSANTGFFGIQISYCQNNMMVMKNKITLPNGGYGVYIYYCSGILGSEGLTANNAISIGGANAAYGIYPYYSSFQNIYYNSVNIYSNNATATALYLSGYTANVNHKIKNNILVYTGINTSGMAIYVATPVMVSSSNNNDLFSTGTNLGYWNGNCATLAYWKTASTKDSNSVSVDPAFVSQTDLHTYLSDLNAHATAIPFITDDINGSPRNATNPDIGAYEFTIPPKNIGIVAVLQPTSSCSHTGADNVVVHLKNFGSANIDTADVYYRINSGTTVHEVMIHTILPDLSYDYTFTTQANLLAAGNYTFKVYAYVNGDTIHLNDTIQNYTIYSGYNFLSGPYTQSFESTEYFGDWSTLDVNADNYGWTMPIAGNAHTGNNSVQLYNGGTNTGNDWLFSRCFNMDAGSSYKIDFWYKASYAFSPQNIDLMVGNDNTPAAMTATLTSLASITNTTYQKATVTFIPALSGTYYFGWWGHSALNYDYAYIDDINIAVLPPQEATLVSITSPISGCGLSNSELVKIEIFNSGGAMIYGNLTAKYKIIGGSTTVSEAVTQQIAVNDTINFTFSIPANLSVTTQDSTYKILSWLELIGDPIHINDTVLSSIQSYHLPASPTVVSAFIPYGGIGVLHASASDSLYWYSVPIGGTSVGNGSSYTTPVLFGTTVYYVEARTGAPNIKITEVTQYSSGTGATSPYPSWFTTNDWDGLEITNLGSAIADMTGYSVHVEGPANIDYTIPAGVTLAAGEVMVLSRYGAAADDPAHKFYVMSTTESTSSGVANGYYIKNTLGEVVDAVATNSYTFSAGSGVTALDWSGNIGYDGGYAGVIRTISDNNTASDWSISSTSAPQTIASLNPTLTVGSGGGGCASARIPDTAFVTGIPACDMSVQTIHTPNSGVLLTTNEVVTVRVKNYGTATALNVPIHYVVNGGTVVDDVIPSVSTNDTVLFTFTTPVDLSVFATYNLKVYTDLPCDTTKVNDTAYKVITCSPLVYCTSIPAYPSDEEIASVTLNGATNAYNCTTVAPGPGSVLNEYSNFTTLPPLTTLSMGIANSFTILQDECNGSAAYYNGLAIWVDLNRDGDFTDAGEQLFVEPTTTLGPRTITGTITIPQGSYVGVTTMRIICAEGSAGTSLTPCMTYYYGETEDYSIRISPPIPHDAGVISFYQPTTVQDEGVSISVQMIVKNFGLDTIKNSSNMTVSYSYNGGTPQSIIWNGGDIAPLATDTAIMPNFTVLANAHLLCGWTVLAGDSNTFNDTICTTINGTPQHDAGVTVILSPAAGLVEGSTETVQAIFKNFGVDTIISMNLGYKINGVVQASQPWTGTLLPNATDTITFVQTFVVPSASFNICAYTSLSTDANHANDTTCKTSYGVFTSTLPYYDNFDGSIVNFSQENNGTGSIWELGTPSYGVTNSAYSAPNAWDVNLDSAYTNNATASLYTQNFDFSTAISAKIKFKVNYNVETGWDGVRLDYSTDAGVVWQTLGVMNDPLGVNWYNDDALNSSSLPAWTDNSNGWKQCEYKLNLLNNVPLVRFRFVFTSDGSGILDGFSIDDFSIAVPSPKDAGVEMIKAPLVQAPAGSHKVVKVLIHNYGTDTLTSIPVSFMTNMGTPTTETWLGQLAPDDTITYQFIGLVTIPSGAFSLCSYTGLPLDGDHLNDTTCTTITGVPTFSVPYSDNFEGPVYFFTTGNLWEWGTPSSTTINAAYSPTHAWKTNLTGTYPNNANDDLYTPLFNFSTVDSAYLDFYHWYDTQSGSDGGNIQYSINGGNWLTLGLQNDPAALNWYNATVNGSPCWSGSSAGYVHSRFRLNSVPGNPIINASGPVQLRYHFISDASTNYDGWAVDNFQIVAPPIPNDIGVDSILLPNAATQTGAPVTVQVRIHNFGTNTITSFPVRYVINSNPVVNEICTISLLPNVSTNYTFTTTFNSPGSPYTVCAFTHLTGDTYYWNDSTCASYGVTPGLNDVGVIHILTPTDSTISGNSYTVSVTIKNFGLNTQTTIPVKYFRNSVLAGAGNWNGTLLFGDTAVYNVLIPFTSPLTLYSLCATTVLVGDVNLLNDTTCKSVYGYVGIDSYDFNSFQLMQNIPNPSNNHTSIAFYVPSDDKVRFDLVDLLGKSVLTKEMDAVVGKNELDLDVNNLGEGIYFYSVSYKGQKLTKRMVITK